MDHIYIGKIQTKIINVCLILSTCLPLLTTHREKTKNFDEYAKEEIIHKILCIKYALQTNLLNG